MRRPHLMSHPHDRDDQEETMPPHRPPRPPRCWVCGTPDQITPDPLYAPRLLCRGCRRYPLGSGHRDSRSASALLVALALPPAWRSGWRRETVKATAVRRRIVCWDDLPPSTAEPDAPFGWLRPAALEAARGDLQAAAAEFDRARTPGA